MTTQVLATRSGQLDWLGVLCSFACAIHCAAVPILVATLPSLTNVLWLADPLFHQVVAVICGVLVVRAILPGYRVHRNGRVVALASTGMTLLFVAAFILPDACCSPRSRDNQTAISNVGHERVAKKILLVSASASFPDNHLVSFHQTEQVGDLAERQSCDSISKNGTSGTSRHATTISRPLLLAVHLESHLGTTLAQQVISAQPFLSPIGGIFLIVAHAMNIRLRCCRRSTCRRC